MTLDFMMTALPALLATEMRGKTHRCLTIATHKKVLNTPVYEWTVSYVGHTFCLAKCSFVTCIRVRDHDVRGFQLVCSFNLVRRCSNWRNLASCFSSFVLKVYRRLWQKCHTVLNDMCIQVCELPLVRFVLFGVNLATAKNAAAGKQRCVAHCGGSIVLNDVFSISSLMPWTLCWAACRKQC